MGKRIDADDWNIPRRASQLLDVPETTLRRAIENGEVRTVMLGGDLLVCHLDDVDKLARAARRPGRPPHKVVAADE